MSRSTVSLFPTMSCKYNGRYFSTNGTSNSNLPTVSEPAPPAPPNQVVGAEEEEEEDEEEEKAAIF